MYHQSDIHVLIEKMETANKKQLFYARLQCIFSLAAALCCFVLLLICIGFVPQIKNLTNQANGLMTNLQALSLELSILDLSGLETIVDELAAVDLTGTVSHIDSLVTASQGGIEATVEKLNSINLDALNKTIEDLSVVVERLARITKIFG